MSQEKDSGGEKMPLTHQELCDKLKNIDEISLLEILNITSEDIIDRFGDLIENNRDNFEDDLEELR